MGFFDMRMFLLLSLLAFVRAGKGMHAMWGLLSLGFGIYWAGSPVVLVGWIELFAWIGVVLAMQMLTSALPDNCFVLQPRIAMFLGGVGWLSAALLKIDVTSFNTLQNSSLCGT